MLFSRKGNVVGLDIGSSSIKLLELAEMKGGYQVRNFGVAPLPPEAIVDGALMDSVTIVDSIRGLANALRIKTKDVVTSVSGHSVIVKKINIPTMTEDELEESIQWEAERYIPFDINDVNIDFQILGPTEGSEELMDMILVAAKKDIINDYLSVIIEAGFNPVIVDIDAFALENMFEANYPVARDEVVALANIGASVTNINILRRGISSFTRDIFTGGNAITEEIQRQLNVDFDEAENLKLGNRMDETSQKVVQEVLKSALNSLATEITKSLDFFRSTSSQEKVDKLVLSGGCAKINAIENVIGQQANIPVEIANPFKEIDCSKRDLDVDYLTEMEPIMAVSVGLALRRAGDK
ncbi:MAG: type IV pilus assembly protein PilM [Syntrophobacterales bacterium]|nr:MAG: type IV pilus assembly protein PilM [Syntrophobacterales bacterium]